jgi:WD40 repeat protein
MHTGPVLCVRWAHSGRWLASGSDDEIVMVWDLDPCVFCCCWASSVTDGLRLTDTRRGKFGAQMRLMSRAGKHSNGFLGTKVVCVAFHSLLAQLTTLKRCNGCCLVSWWSLPRNGGTGFESHYLGRLYFGYDPITTTVFVLFWSRIHSWVSLVNFLAERVCKLDQHQGFVKGVCWDPVGEYLATQSDDRTVKIWRTKDWEQEAEVRKPFEDSPGSTFYRRLRFVIITVSYFMKLIRT